MVKEISSNSAFSLLNTINNSILIDVRTKVELQEIGVASVPRILFVEYDSSHESYFIDIVKQKINNKNMSIFIICRSGKRSLNAAKLMENNGYKNCYNIEDGMEGGYIEGGWIRNNLPYNFLGDYAK
jgi:rhodanese-related sulfurtransferase